MTNRPESASVRPVSLRISVTDRCQLCCLYCTPANGVQRARRSEILSSEEILRFTRALKAQFGLSKVRITGGEPLIRPGIVKLIEMLACEGLPDLALTTNGQLLAEMASELKRAGLHRVNVSLDTLNPDTFHALARGGELRLTLRGIEAAIGQGISPVKINTVLLRGYNDLETRSLAQWALQRRCAIRFIELMPIGCPRDYFKRLFVSASEVRARLEKSFGLKPLPHKPGQSSRDYLASDRSGRQGIIGFICPQTQPFCHGCRRLRLTSDGRLISCLKRGDGPSVRSLLRLAPHQAAHALRRIVVAQLSNKLQVHAFESARPMVRIGG